VTNFANQGKEDEMTRYTLRLEGDTERTPEEALLLLRSLIRRMRGQGMLVTLKKLAVTPTAQERRVLVMTARSAPGWTAKRQDEAVKALQLTGVLNELSLARNERLRWWIGSFSEKAKHEKPSKLLLDWLNQGYMQYLQSLQEGESQDQFRLLKAFYDHVRGIESVVPDSRVHDLVRILEQEIDSGDAGSLPVDQALGDAPRREGNFFVVPRVIE